MAEKPWVTTAEDTDFEEVVLVRSKEVPVLIDFWAEWCRPCRVLGPLIERLAEEYAGQFLLVKIDIDRAPLLTQQFQVDSLPMVLALVDGRLAGRFVGALPEPQVREFLAQILPSTAERLLKSAEALEATQPAAARAAYEQVLEIEPKNGRALAALAELSAVEGAIERAAELIEGVAASDPGWERAQRVQSRLEFRAALERGGSVEALEQRAQEHPQDLQARLELGLAQAATGAYANALETLVTIVEMDRDFGNQHAKEAMVKVFAIIGPQTPLANDYRARLARALY